MKGELMYDDAGVRSYIIKRLKIHTGEYLVSGTTYRNMRADFYDQCGGEHYFPPWEKLEIIHDGRPRNNNDTLIQRVEKSLKDYGYTCGAIIEMASGINTVFSVEMLHRKTGEVTGSMVAIVTPDKDDVLLFNQFASTKL